VYFSTWDIVVFGVLYLCLGFPLKQLSCSDWEKTEHIYDIDISGSELIVACKEEGIKRFILDY